jgi:hypothetical protein
MVGGKRSSDDDTSKDGVVIQRVIHDVGGGSSYPALLMKVKLKVRALWSIIENGGANQQEEMIATMRVWDSQGEGDGQGGLGRDHDHEGQ